MQYHVGRQGQTYGPYPEEDVRRMLAEGRLLPTDLCWTEGMPGWEPLGKVFRAAGTAATPVIPPAMAPQAPAPGIAAPVQQPAQAQYAQMYRGAPVQAVPHAGSGWPKPPDLHWALVFLLTIVTCGIFGLIWLYRQAAFVKRLDPRSQAIQYLLGYIAVTLLSTILAVAGARMTTPLILNLILPWVALALLVATVFTMRSVLLRHYNSVENIGLRLNPVLTFFFALLYFQYHFTRISRWKQTGRLD